VQVVVGSIHPVSFPIVAVAVTAKAQAYTSVGILRRVSNLCLIRVKVSFCGARMEPGSSPERPDFRAELAGAEVGAGCVTARLKLLSLPFSPNDKGIHRWAI
jgi:hypothetical protein